MKRMVDWSVLRKSGRQAALCCAIAGVLFAGSSCRRENGDKKLLCYVGGTMRPVVERLAKMYRKETGVEVELDYAGSGELLIKIEQTKRGDLYICHDPFMAAAQLKGLVRRSWVPASVAPVIVVPKGNPKNIQGLRDLTKPGIRVVLTHQQYSTTGHIVERIVTKYGLTNLYANVISRTRGGGAAANAVMLGTADAAIVWDAVAHLRREKLDAVPIEPDLRLKRGVDAVTTATFRRIEMDYIRVGMAVLTTSRQPVAAEKFAEFVASERNRHIWDEFGFSPPDPSRSFNADISTNAVVDSGKPILVHCAAGMRLPVSEMVKIFSSEHGVTVDVSYDGSNRLLSQIQLTHKGDIYIAGDSDYIEMAEARGLTDRTAVICRFVPVIMVRKGNPKEIKSLADMTKPGVRIAAADEKSAAIGRLLPRILKLNGIALDDWRKNVVMNSTTVNELAMAVKLGSVDAAVVWNAVAANYRDDCETISMPKNISPEVGAAVLSFSGNKKAAADFLEFMCSKQGTDILRKNGYAVK